VQTVCGNDFNAANFIINQPVRHIYWNGTRQSYIDHVLVLSFAVNKLVNQLVVSMKDNTRESRSRIVEIGRSKILINTDDIIGGTEHLPEIENLAILQPSQIGTNI